MEKDGGTPLGTHPALLMAVPTPSGVQTIMNHKKGEVGGTGRSGGRQTVPGNKPSQHNNNEKGQIQMRKFLATLMIFFLFVALSPMVVEAASPCPPEVQAAKDMLAKQIAKSQDVQAPRALAGARQDIQAPRSQDIQAPRGQDVQAPRGQDIQAPRGQKAQDVQAPPGQAVHAPRTADIQ